ncbi:uncharacterized protein TRAVEDRAFT_52169 [Trametes versicolor FP-101664 SS1]|uniref:uncharacterized protein n=1 Tax=Trametes versicolor (strain FP-101664) TaxID=717944 RepID=UPI00046215CF|nr:uncharacterized protein TRAVEDRAFT_52169 [Trametes versicolor FP-101664 SS1]EIW54464.1 hypothetical protein TRAVEDRAFT_52169 [Trametes versicolor FP-101664 SS1]
MASGSGPSNNGRHGASPFRRQNKITARPPGAHAAVTDPYYGHEETAKLCSRFVTHLFTCPDLPPLSTSIPPAPSPALGNFIAYALHRTRLHTSVTFAALYLLQRLKARFPAARGSSGHRLFISAFMIASKVICDDTYSNKSWSIVGQGMFALREINQMDGFGFPAVPAAADAAAAGALANAVAPPELEPELLVLAPGLLELILIGVPIVPEPTTRTLWSSYPSGVDGGALLAGLVLVDMLDSGVSGVFGADARAGGCGAWCPWPWPYGLPACTGTGGGMGLGGDVEGALVTRVVKLGGGALAFAGV